VTDTFYSPHVRDFGAKGDGKTLDTPTVQAALRPQYSEHRDLLAPLRVTQEPIVAADKYLIHFLLEMPSSIIPPSPCMVHWLRTPRLGALLQCVSNPESLVFYLELFTAVALAFPRTIARCL